MIKNKLGFTLIELLAVVLIISILTSIAVPKYRRTVERAAATEALVNVRSIFESAKRYKAATSLAPTKLKGLDISFYEASSEEDAQFTIGNYTYEFDNSWVRACHENYCFYMYYTHPTYGKDTLICKIENTGKYDWMCDAIGGDETTPGSNEYVMGGVIGE